MSYPLFVTIALILAVLFSFAAWYNTQIIFRELTDIKKHFNMKEDRKTSFSGHDLDQEN